MEVVKRVDSIQNSPSSPQLVLIIHTIMTRPIQKQHGDILIKKCNIAPQRSHNGERQLSHCNNSYCNHGYILVGPNKAPHISTQCYPTQYRPNTTKTEQFFIDLHNFRDQPNIVLELKTFSLGVSLGRRSATSNRYKRMTSRKHHVMFGLLPRQLHCGHLAGVGWGVWLSSSSHIHLSIRECPSFIGKFWMICVVIDFSLM